MWKLLFSFEGRINRAKFWAVWAPVVALVFVLQVLFEIAKLVEDRAWPLFVLCVPAFLLVWICWAIQCKRWQDQGKSATPWRFLLNFVPVIGTIWILVECGMLRGTVGPNMYGPDPLEPKHPPETASSRAEAPSTVRVAAETSPVQDEVGEKYAMLLKYSDKARSAEARLGMLPGELRERFKQEVVANPSHVEEIAARLLAEAQKRLTPFGDPKLDALYQKLEAHGPQAQAEFQRVLKFLKGQVDPEEVFIQIVADSKKGITVAPSPVTNFVPFEFNPHALEKAKSQSPNPQPPPNPRPSPSGSPNPSPNSGHQGRMAEIARQTEELRRAMGSRSDSGKPTATTDEKMQQER